MSILEEFWKALRGDPPPPPPLRNPPADVVLFEEMHARRKLEIERDCYRRELRMRGVTDLQMQRMVEFYENGLRASVGLRARG